MGLHENKNMINEHLATMLPELDKKPKILVVDDEKIALKNLSHLLKKEGYTVITADNGTDALDMLETSFFDIVLTDLRMGKVDGMDVLHKTKSMWPDTKVVIFTGFATLDTAVEAMRKGAFHYIEKPLQLDEVRSIVKEALGKA